MVKPIVKELSPALPAHIESRQTAVHPPEIVFKTNGVLSRVIPCYPVFCRVLPCFRGIVVISDFSGFAAAWLLLDPQPLASVAGAAIPLILDSLYRR